MYRSVFTGGIATYPHSTVALTELKLINDKFRQQCAGGL
jgi:hypothetical protein